MTHTLPYAVNCSILLTDLPLLRRPEAARAHRFDAVEFWWPFEAAVPADAEVDAFVRAALSIIDRMAETDGVALLADLYHLGVNGDDVPALIARDPARVGHVQIADAPGRGEPGTGSLPLDGWLSDLQEAGYAGWVSLEYRSAATDPFAWLPLDRRPSTTS